MNAECFTQLRDYEDRRAALEKENDRLRETYKILSHKYDKACDAFDKLTKNARS